MSEEEERHDVDNGLGEGPSTFRSTPSKPVLDETWTQVEELPDPNDSDYTDEEVNMAGYSSHSTMHAKTDLL